MVLLVSCAFVEIHWAISRGGVTGSASGILSYVL